MIHLFTGLARAVALSLSMAATAHAQSADGANPKSVAPRLQYQSAFTDYKPWQDLPLRDWRAVNDTVRDATAAGAGHAAHSATPSPAAASAPARPKSGHAGHPTHGGPQ